MSSGAIVRRRGRTFHARRGRVLRLGNFVARGLATDGHHDAHQRDQHDCVSHNYLQAECTAAAAFYKEALTNELTEGRPSSVIEIRMVMVRHLWCEAGSLERLSRASDFARRRPRATACKSRSQRRVVYQYRHPLTCASKSAKPKWRFCADPSPRSRNAGERPAVPATVREGDLVWTNVAVHIKGSFGSFRPIDDKPALTLNFDKHRGRPAISRPAKNLAQQLGAGSVVPERKDLPRNLRAAGVPTPRTDYATVELNGRPAWFVRAGRKDGTNNSSAAISKTRKEIFMISAATTMFIPPRTRRLART